MVSFNLLVPLPYVTFHAAFREVTCISLKRFARSPLAKNLRVVVSNETK